MNFSGWVPTVTGHLSFSILGMGTFPTKCIRSELTNGLAVLQQRDLLDVLVPFADDWSVAAFCREKLSNWTLRLSGKFTFLMIVDEPAAASECCAGTIVVLANSQSRSAASELKSKLRAVEYTPLAKEDLLDFAAANSCYTAKFKLERKGKLTLSVEPKEDRVTAIDTILANQAFYFVKDIAHVHQHHDPKHDGITVLTQEVGEDEGWKENTAHALYRAIIRYKRFRSEKALFRASGVLAYTKAFQKNYPPGERVKSFAHAELEQSLAVSRAELQHFDQKRIARIETFRNFFFSLFALVISVSYLARLAGTPDILVDEKVIHLASLLAQYPLQAIAITFLASLCWMVTTHQIDPSNNEITIWVTRLLQGFRRRYFMFFNIVLTMAFSAICYWLLIGFS